MHAHPDHGHPLGVAVDRLHHAADRAAMIATIGIQANQGIVFRIVTTVCIILPFVAAGIERQDTGGVSPVALL